MKQTWNQINRLRVSARNRIVSLTPVLFATTKEYCPNLNESLAGKSYGLELAKAVGHL